jgi:hypothetical protein
LQRLACGEQTPAHVVPLQTNGHVDVFCQPPLSSHDCNIDVPLHRAVPGVHTPAQPVDEHT